VRGRAAAHGNQALSCGEADAVDGRVYQAVALDPLTGALLTLEQVRAMTNELFTAHAALLEPHGW
jgi:hypothetical protein